MELVQASAEQLPFPPMSFDVVVSTLVFHHLPREIKRRAIAEIARVLTAEGRFLLADVGPATSLPFKVLTALLLSLATLVHLKEARSARENLQGVLPLLLKEAGFVNARRLLRSANLDRPLVLPFFVENSLQRIRTPALMRQWNLTPTSTYRALTEN